MARRVILLLSLVSVLAALAIAVLAFVIWRQADDPAASVPCDSCDIRHQRLTLEPIKKQ